MHTPNRACARRTPIGRAFEFEAHVRLFLDLQRRAVGAKKQNALLRELGNDNPADPALEFAGCARGAAEFRQPGCGAAYGRPGRAAPRPRRAIQSSSSAGTRGTGHREAPGIRWHAPSPVELLVGLAG
jgi:hypothetical protein